MSTAFSSHLLRRSGLGLRGPPLTSSRCVVRAASARWLTSDGYLHKTVIPTDKFQDSLPKLPVPKLEDTAKRFLYAATPLVSAEELAAAEADVQAFLDGAGPVLQKELEERAAARYTSFISDWWFDMYLANRDPLMLNVNPQLAFLQDPAPEKNDQAERAASLIVSSARFIRTLRDNHLEPELFQTYMSPIPGCANFGKTEAFKHVCAWAPRSIAFYVGAAFGAYALDMSQFGGLIGSTRVPRAGKDELVKSPDSRHVVVQRGSRFYTFDILRDDFTAVPAAEVKAHVEAILAAPDASSETSEAVGLLTSAERDAWAAAREGLVADPTNAAALEAIDSALFAVCLEDAAPDDFNAVNRVMLHGDARNRWFDKSFQLIVAANGRSAVNFEHAWGDGVAVLRYFNEVFEDSVASPLIGPTPPDAAEAAAHAKTGESLPWNLAPADRAAIEAAGEAADALIDSVALSVVECVDLNSKWIKANKLSPDGVLQMCFQLAHYKLFGSLGATYESASTAAFKHGRTETIRSATPEALRMCEAIAGPDPAATAADKDAAIRAAVKNHGRITKDALLGNGWDRHFFALRKLAEEGGQEVPAVFTGKAYATLSEIILSTSTLASPALDAGGFGPVGPKCYAIGYRIRDEGARFYVMTNKDLETQEFADALLASAAEMRAVIEEAAKA